MNRHALALWLIVAAVLAGGCGESQAPVPPKAPSPPPEPAAKAVVPDLPDEEEPESGMEILIKEPATERAIGGAAYERDAKAPAGKLIGACKWAPAPPRRKAPPPEPAALDGAQAIRNPEKGEVDYYKNLQLKQDTYIADAYPGTYPRGVVLTLRGVRSGPRGMLPRATFMVREGAFKPHIEFCPVHERVMFGTYDSYPTHVRMRSLATGQVALDELLTAFDRDTIKPLPGGGVHYTRRPAMLQSSVVHDTGVYAVTCRRHPWKSAYVAFVDNPYALVSDGANFTLDSVPVGKWQMDAWHPRFKPVKASLDVEIRKDETTEIAVEFHPPDCLKAKE
ncbi:MAG TPA: hypothetical protein VNE39_16970 [Planctomycetota bacterium]|nr:hypothetical protein [Planctomycetota bacterium]